MSKISGRIALQFFPGDHGPFGVVGDPGLLLGVIGEVTIAVVADTGMYTSFSLDGQATDICAEPS